jgi:LacI family transcriptional regulator
MPEQLGIVGFDELPWGHLIRPGLPTVVQPTYKLGRTAGDLLTARIAAPTRPVSTVTLATRLQVPARTVPQH